MFSIFCNSTILLGVLAHFSRTPCYPFSEWFCALLLQTKHLIWSIYKVQLCKVFAMRMQWYLHVCHRQYGWKCLEWQPWLNCSFQLWDVRSPHSQIVGPVTYMWRSFSGENDKSETEGDLSTAHSFDEKSRSSLRRQLWIWIHPAALDDGLSAIRFACERQVLPLFLI